jgi:hypothetical protein
MNQNFNPSEYKRFKDLPRKFQGGSSPRAEQYVKEGEGFVGAEAWYEYKRHEQEAQELNERRKFIDKLLGREKVTPMDLLHADALEYEQKRKEVMWEEECRARVPQGVMDRLYQAEFVGRRIGERGKVLGEGDFDEGNQGELFETKYKVTGLYEAVRRAKNLASESSYVIFEYRGDEITARVVCGTGGARHNEAWVTVQNGDDVYQWKDFGFYGHNERRGMLSEKAKARRQVEITRQIELRIEKFSKENPDFVSLATHPRFRAFLAKGADVIRVSPSETGWHVIQKKKPEIIHYERWETYCGKHGSDAEIFYEFPVYHSEEEKTVLGQAGSGDVIYFAVKPKEVTDYEDQIGAGSEVREEGETIEDAIMRTLPSNKSVLNTAVVVRDTNWSEEVDSISLDVDYPRPYESSSRRTKIWLLDQKKEVMDRDDYIFKRAKEIGWELHEWCFWEGDFRYKNPDGSWIFNGSSVFKNKEGVLADDYYVLKLLHAQEKS